MARRAHGLLLACAAIAFARVAHADPTPAEAELATARALFSEGLAREDAKDWAGALERFRRVADIRVTPQVLYNIALCNEKLGKTASADTYYARVEEQAAATPDPAVHELARLASTRRADLRANIPELVVEPPRDAEVAVSLDGAPVDRASLGAPMRVDPGPHEIVAMRRGVAAHRAFTVGPGRNVVQAPTPAEPKPPAAAVASGGAAPGRERRTVPAGAWVTGAITLASTAVAVVAVVVRGSAIRDLDAACGPDRASCPEDKRGEVDRVGTLTTVANVSAGVGAAALVATGAILWFSWRPSPNANATMRTTVAPNGLGVRIVTRF